MDFIPGLRISILLIVAGYFTCTLEDSVDEIEMKLWEELSVEEPSKRLSKPEMEFLRRARKPYKKHSPTGFTPSTLFTFASDCYKPSNFPPTIPIIQGEYRNWAENIQVSNMWLAIPRTYRDVLILANWAYLNDYMLRPKGFSNTWAPLTVTKWSSCSNTILVDTTQFLVQMKMLSSKGQFRAVRVQTGASMESLLSFLEDYKCGLFSVPVMGEISIGGVLAVGSHGSGVATTFTGGHSSAESTDPVAAQAPRGYSSGSLSNLILSFKAVVWEESSETYVIRKFSRAERDARAFLTHLGRAFLTEVTLLTGPAYKLRCQTISDYSATELLAHPDLGEKDHDTFASLVAKHHSVDLSIFPYTDSTQIMMCNNRSKNHQDISKVVSTPYPFSYLEHVPRTVSVLLSQFLSGRHYLAPMISRLNHQFNSVGIRLSNNEDIWGPSKNLLVRYKSTFTHSFSSGYAILTTRQHLQHVASEVYSLYLDLLNQFKLNWQYPQNEPLQLTVTGLDDPGELPQFARFEPPIMSTLAPVKGKNFDVALIVGVNVYPGTRYFEKFMREFESQLFLRYTGDQALVRPEWSKAWAFTDSSAWDHHVLIKRLIPKSYGSDWHWAVSRLNYYDPHHVFTNPFLNYIMQANATRTGLSTKLAMLRW